MCGLTTEPVSCGRLIVESTFRLPVFHFLSREEGRKRILGFARECLGQGAVPVLRIRLDGVRRF